MGRQRSHFGAISSTPVAFLTTRVISVQIVDQSHGYKERRMTQQTSNTSASRVDIIQMVKTPLGFFTLIVLVVEVILGISANLSQGADRTYLIIGMLILIFLLVIIVAGLAFFRPEALSGKRPQDLEFQNLSPVQKIARYRELIEQETKNSILVNFHVPDGYKPEISSIDKFTFGFCYPQDWSFVKFAQHVQY